MNCYAISIIQILYFYDVGLNKQKIELNCCITATTCGYCLKSRLWSPPWKCLIVISCLWITEHLRGFDKGRTYEIQWTHTLHTYSQAPLFIDTYFQWSKDFVLIWTCENKIQQTWVIRVTAIPDASSMPSCQIWRFVWPKRTLPVLPGVGYIC